MSITTVTLLQSVKAMADNTEIGNSQPRPEIKYTCSLHHNNKFYCITKQTIVVCNSKIGTDF